MKPREWSELSVDERLAIGERLLGRARYPFYRDWEDARRKRQRWWVLAGLLLCCALSAYLTRCWLGPPGASL